MIPTIADIRGAVARGWCHDANSHKEMDSDLALAIADEVFQLFLPGATSTGNFRKDLEALINRYSRENGSDTPDFILAGFLDNVLVDFDSAVTKRTEWYKPAKTEPVEPPVGPGSHLGAVEG